MSTEGRSDAELIESVRTGGESAGSEAWGELFQRHHGAALGYARNLAGESIAADLVSECLEKTLVLLRRGKGPTGALRPYLFTAIRRAHVDHLRRSSKEILRDDMTELATARGGGLTGDEADARFEATTIMRAFRSLPERWRTVLWHTAVASSPLEQVARDLGMNANSVAALSFRAREGLRRAYLAEHLTRTPDPECRAVMGALVSYLRGGLRPRQADQVAAHLSRCASCAAARADLADINANLGVLLAPVVMAGAGAVRMVPDDGGPAAQSATRVDHSMAVRSGIGLAVGVSLTVALWVILTGAEHDRTVPEEASSPVIPSTPTSTSPPTRIAGPGEPAAAAAPATSAIASLLQPSPTVTPPPLSPTPPTTVATMASTSAPTPTPSRAADVAVGEPSQRELTTTDPRWYHVEFPISDAGGGDLVLQLRLSNVGDHDVHVDHAYGLWRCTEAESADSSTQELTCSLSEEEGRPNDFGIDVSSPAGDARVAVKVHLADGRDPRRDNNTAHVTLRSAPAP